MKNYLVSSLLVTAFAALLPSPAAGADGDATTVKFSDPTKPGKLRISLGRGDLRVRGTDATEVTIKSDGKAATPSVRKDGLRVLTASSSFSVSEKDNVIMLDSGGSGRRGSDGDFDIVVPRGTSISIPGATGDMRIVDIAGDVEIKSFNGEIELEGLRGGAQVETMNGEIEASFAELPANKPLSFVSMNGEIAIRVPGEAKANVRLRTQNGVILTDFNDQALVTKTETLPSTRVTRSRTRTSSASSSDNEVHVAVREAAHEIAQAARETAVIASNAARAAVAEVRASTDEHAPRTPHTPMAPLPPMTGGKLVSGTLNGGGPEIILTAMNGDVILRKNQAKK